MSRDFSNVFGGLGLAALLCATLGLMACPVPALGHRIHVSAHVHDGAIHGEAHYPDDTPVRGATVTAYDPAGEKIGQTTTDEKGSFTLEARIRCDHRLLVDTGDGHGAEYVIRAAELHGDQDPLEGIRQELSDLREQLWLRDVLGGLGYIVGITGVAFYFLGVRRKRSRREG
jgi:nickel transport protein